MSVKMNLDFEVEGLDFGVSGLALGVSSLDFGVLGSNFEGEDILFKWQRNIRKSFLWFFAEPNWEEENIPVQRPLRKD